MKTLVAGIGNVLLRDDGFGVEVVRRLQETALPPDVHLKDFGVRGLDLAYEGLEAYDSVVLVDALSRGASPGTLFVLLPGAGPLEATDSDHGHGTGSAAVLRIARELGARLERVHVVACEPERVDEGIELSPAVECAVSGAVQIVQGLLAPRDVPRAPREARV